MGEAGVVATRSALPELAGVWWRPRVSERRLRRTGLLWTVVAVAHSVPFVLAAVALSLLKPVTIPIGIVLLVHAWAIPELYAARGANALKAGRRRGGAPGAEPSGAEQVAMGLLADLLSHPARALREHSGLVLERGRLGVWLLGEAGALLVRPGGRRVHCYCVKVTDRELPPSDRAAHLLLALREDEAGFATVANLAFAGAVWRMRRRVAPQVRDALSLAAGEARAMRRAAT